MKIITSTAVCAESSRVGGEIAKLIEPSFVMPPLSSQFAAMDEQCNALQNFKFELDGATQEVTIEIDDKVIIAVLQLYGRVASVVHALAVAAKCFWPVLKQEFKEVAALANEPRERS